jgi:hypothetical protein
LLQLTQLLAQLAKLGPLVGGEPVCTFAVIPIGLFDPILDRLLSGFKPVGQLRRRAPVSGQLDDLVSELLWVWRTCSWHGKYLLVRK